MTSFIHDRTHTPEPRIQLQPFYARLKLTRSSCSQRARLEILANVAFLLAGQTLVFLASLVGKDLKEKEEEELNLHFASML